MMMMMMSGAWKTERHKKEGEEYVNTKKNIPENEPDIFLLFTCTTHMVK